MGSGFGIVSLILSIIGIGTLFLRFIFFNFFFIGPAGIVFFVLAIIFGIIGIAKDDSKAPGIIGLIIGIVGAIIWVVGFFFIRLIREIIDQLSP